MPSAKPMHIPCARTVAEPEMLLCACRQPLPDGQVSMVSLVMSVKGPIACSCLVAGWGRCGFGAAHIPGQPVRGPH